MDIHEYQAKEVLSNFGVTVPRGALAYSPEQAAYRARELGGERWVVKAQVHAGGRGKAGGVKICASDTEIQDATEGMFGQKLVTHQTGPEGKGIYRVYVEEALQIDHEFYLGFVLDRSSQRVMIVASAEGGMEIEDISADRPDSIVRATVEPAVGLQEFQGRELAFKLGLDASLVQQFVRTLQGCYRAFTELDATMVEINPLVVSGDNRVIALDAKMTFDANALFRHPHVAELRDKSQEDPRESRAADRGLSYVGLEGNIGCIVNGAGLAMATMDTIKLAGGEPANFLDIGGGATPDRVAKAFRLVISDGNVEAILVNIFAGINRCDWVAEGVVQALRETQVDVPVIVRLAGTNVEEGQKILAQSGLPIIRATTLMEAAERAVGAWRNDLSQGVVVRDPGASKSLEAAS
ncbi:malate--CoA ligase subunit beta [Algirhabdus cladophorae]|uniref:malate--CoA ligase subunit beta n=1 Tax=Algirhabdus cladophorae TaxID=3377108 RepID=UPI003B84A0DF